MKFRFHIFLRLCGCSFKLIHFSHLLAYPSIRYANETFRQRQLPHNTLMRNFLCCRNLEVDLAAGAIRPGKMREYREKRVKFSNSCD
jgi:hypothetical protein